MTDPRQTQPGRVNSLRLAPYLWALGACALLWLIGRPVFSAEIALLFAIASCFAVAIGQSRETGSAAPPEPSRNDTAGNSRAATNTDMDDEALERRRDRRREEERRTVRKESDEAVTKTPGDILFAGVDREARPYDADGAGGDGFGFGLSDFSRPDSGNDGGIGFWSRDRDDD